MDIHQLFETAGGSVRGTAHLRHQVNNQDAFGIATASDMIAVVVCDGTTLGLKSWTHSEVGAQLSVKFMLNALMKWGAVFLQQPHMLSADKPFPYLDLIRDYVVAGMSGTLWYMGDEVVDNTIDYFLSTILSVLITPYGVCIASIGDGLYYLNGEEFVLGPYPDNEPPYIAYNLIGGFEPLASLDFRTHYLPTNELHSLLIGSDGVSDLCLASGLQMPGLTEKVGPISQFWEDDMYFRNPVAVARKLSMINRHAVMLDREAVRVTESHGLLEDDTTLVVIRRRDA